MRLLPPNWKVRLREAIPQVSAKKIIAWNWIDVLALSRYIIIPRFQNYEEKKGCLGKMPDVLKHLGSLFNEHEGYDIYHKIVM